MRQEALGPFPALHSAGAPTPGGKSLPWDFLLKILEEGMSSTPETINQ